MGNRVRGLNASQLEDLEGYASLQFDFVQLAILLEVDEDRLRELIARRDSDTAKAYDRGRLLAQVEVRTAILEAAKNGSTPAQKLYVDFMGQADDAVREERDDEPEIF